MLTSLFFFYKKSYKFLLIFSFALLFLSSCSYSNKKIKWRKEYSKAINLSQKENKPLFLYFCNYEKNELSKKIEKEIFNHCSFYKKFHNKFIFLKLDFSNEGKNSRKNHFQNQKIKNRFQIKEFPSALILSPQLKIVASRGYNASICPKEYTKHLLEILEDYNLLESALSEIDQNNFNSKQLQNLYNKAKIFQREKEQKNFLKKGLELEDNLFFLSEKYHMLVKEGKTKSQEAKEIRSNLIKKDPENKEGKHRYLALVDFQELARGFKTGDNPMLVISPLVKYLNLFEKNDIKNSWRIHMTISQYLFSKNKIPEAIEYANQSFQAAPNKRKARIKIAIEHMVSLSMD